MATAPASTPTDPNAQPDPPLTLEQKIDAAVAEASQIAMQFSPIIGAALQAGAELEPVISGFVKMFAGIFAHHAKKAIAAK